MILRIIIKQKNLKKLKKAENIAADNKNVEKKAEK